MRRAAVAVEEVPGEVEEAVEELQLLVVSLVVHQDFEDLVMTPRCSRTFTPCVVLFYDQYVRALFH